MKIICLATNEIGEVAEHIANDSELLRNMGYIKYDEPITPQFNVVSTTLVPANETINIQMPDEGATETATGAETTGIDSIEEDRPKTFFSANNPIAAEVRMIIEEEDKPKKRTYNRKKIK